MSDNNTEQDMPVTDLGTAEVVAHKVTEAPAEMPTLAPEIKKIDVAIRPIISKIPYPDTQLQLENGGQTTSFITKAVKGTEAIANGAMDITGQLVNTSSVLLNQSAQYMGLASELSTKIISTFTEIIMQKSTELVTTAVTYSLKWPIDVSKYSLSYFNVNIGEITKEAMLKGGLSADAFDKLKATKKQMQEEAMKKLEQNAGTALQLKGVEKIKKTLTDIKNGISYVTDYIAEGPAWISDKTNEFVNKYTDDINKTLDKYKNSIITWEQKSSKKVGEKIGKELIEKQSKKIEAKTKKQLEKIQKLQKKAEIKVKTQIALATIKLIALIGL